GHAPEMVMAKVTIGPAQARHGGRTNRRPAQNYYPIREMQIEGRASSRQDDVEASGTAITPGLRQGARQVVTSKNPNLMLPIEACNVYYRFVESKYSTAGGGSMTPNRNDERPTEERRKEIFLALVEAQDQAMDVAQSRKFVSERFGIIESQV